MADYYQELEPKPRLHPDALRVMADETLVASRGQVACLAKALHEIEVDDETWAESSANTKGRYIVKAQRLLTALGIELSTEPRAMER